MYPNPLIPKSNIPIELALLQPKFTLVIVHNWSFSRALSHRDVRTRYAVVVDDVRDGLADRIQCRPVQTLHGARHQSQHPLRRPQHVLVTVPLDCALHLVTLTTDRPTDRRTVSTIET